MGRRSQKAWISPHAIAWASQAPSLLFPHSLAVPGKRTVWGYLWGAGGNAFFIHRPDQQRGRMPGHGRYRDVLRGRVGGICLPGFQPPVFQIRQGILCLPQIGLIPGIVAYAYQLLYEITRESRYRRYACIHVKIMCRNAFSLMHLRQSRFYLTFK